MIFRLGLDSQYVIALILDLAEELLLVLSGVKIVHHADKSVVPVLFHRNIQRRSHDDLVILFHFAVHGHIDLSVFSLDLIDPAVQAGRVLEFIVQGLPDELSAFLPGPEVDLDEVHAGLEVQILQNVRRGDLVKS